MEDSQPVQPTKYSPHQNNQPPLKIYFSNRLQTSPAIASLSSSLGTNLGDSVGRSTTLNDRRRTLVNNHRYSSSLGNRSNATELPLFSESPLQDVPNTSLDAPLLDPTTKIPTPHFGTPFMQSPVGSDSSINFERGEARRGRAFPRKISMNALQQHYQPTTRKDSRTNLDPNLRLSPKNGNGPYSYSRDYFPPSNSQLSSPGSNSESGSPKHSSSKISILEWDISQVTSWLKEVHLEELVEVFEKNDVNGEVLLELDHGLLKQMGLNTIGPRVRCLQAIKSLNRAVLAEFRNDALSKDRPHPRPVAVNGPGPNIPSHLASSIKSSMSSPSLRQDSLSSLNSSNSGTRNGMLLGETQPTFCPLTPASAQPYYSGGGRYNAPRSPPTRSTASPPPDLLYNPHKLAIPAERDIMSLSTVQRYCVKVVGEGGQSRVVDLKNALDSPQTILAKVLAKFSLPGPVNDYAIFVGTGEHTRMLSDEELVTICNSPSHPNKEKFILRKKYSPQTPASYSRSQNKERPATIAKGWDPLPPSDLESPGVAGVEVLFGKSEKNNRANRHSKLFSRRPDSKKIASNLSQYFPAQKLYPELTRSSLPQNTPAPNIVPRSESVISPPTAQNDGSGLDPVSESTNEEAANIVIKDVDENAPVVPPPNGQHTRTTSLSPSSSPLAVSKPNLALPSPTHLSPIPSPLLAPVSEAAPPASPTRSRVSMDMEGWIQGALIGAGSFGNVFLGLLPTIGQVFAVKQVDLPEVANRNENRHKADQVDSLQREISLMRELSHPNIVQYLGSSSTDQHLNIFLEYVPGGSVAARLAERGAFSEDRARHYVKQILEGLEYLHRHNIIHRDIKGGNVLVDDDDNAKIADFGVSKKVQDSVLSVITPHRVSLQGSVYWMAPEVVKQTHYTRKADIWSLGCLVIEMLTGDHPFPSFTQMQAIFKIGTYSAPELPTTASPLTKDFLAATLHPKHAERPSSSELLHHPFVSDVPPPPVSPNLSTSDHSDPETRD